MTTHPPPLAARLDPERQARLAPIGPLAAAIAHEVDHPLGALALVAARGQAAEAPVAAPAAEPAKPRGYHETEHIRRYYRTAAYW